MAWASIGSFLSAGVEASGTTLGTTSGVSTAPVGRVLLVLISCNNTGTGDGDLSEITKVEDTVGNTYTKIKEWTNGQGAAAGGATVGAFYCNVTTQVETSTTITVTFANTITAKCMDIWQFSKVTGNTVSVAGAVQTEVVDNGDAGNLTISGLASQEYLFVRAIASETDGTGIGTFTTSYNSVGTAGSGTGGSEKGHMSFQGEYRILTGTGDSSNPTLTDTTVDLASIYFALQEIAALDTDWIPASNQPYPYRNEIVNY